MRSSRSRVQLTFQFVSFAVALVSLSAFAAGRAPEHGLVGDWVQLTAPFDICGCCDYVRSVIVPDHNLVAAFSVGAGCSGGLAVADFASRPRPGDRIVLGGPPAGAPVAGIFDPSGGRILYLFTEWDGSGPTDLTTWALTLGDTMRWERLETVGRPPFRSEGSTIVDSRGDRLIMFGGLGPPAEGRASLNEVWSFSLRDQQWRRLTPSGALPPGRSGHTAVYDPDRDRMLVFGGIEPFPLSLPRDVWALSLGNHPRWSRLEPAGEGPLGRFGHAAIYDPASRRMVVYGGIDSLGIWGPSYLLPRDVWELTLGGKLSWRALKSRSGFSIPPIWTGAAYDRVLDRLLVGDPANLWSLELDLSDKVRGRRPRADFEPPGILAPRLVLSDVVAQGKPQGDEELRLYDVTGRLMLKRNVTDGAVWLDAFRIGTNAEAVGLAPGVYFAQRRDRAGKTTISRMIVLRR